MDKWLSIKYNVKRGKIYLKLEDILKFYHQGRTLRSSSHQGIIYALKNQILTWKLMASERFPLLPPDYGTRFPLKFELVLFKSKLKSFLFKKLYDI